MSLFILKKITQLLLIPSPLHVNKNRLLKFMDIYYVLYRIIFVIVYENTKHKIIS